MKKKIKVFFIYLGVILLSLIMTVAVCAGFLFFYRDGHIFGIQYISKDEVLMAKTQDVSSLEIKGISVESSGFDIKIDVSLFEDEVKGAMVNKAFGYVHKSKAQASISAKYDETTQLVTFTVVEPQGWVSKKNCYVAIAIPGILMESGIDIDVKSEKGDISIGGSSIVVSNVNVKNVKGNTTLSNLDIRGSINADIGSGWFFVDEKCKTTAEPVNVNIKLDSGKINLSRTEDFDINCVNIEKIKTGEIAILKAVEVCTDGKISGGGKLLIGQVTELVISTLDTDIRIGTIGTEGEDEALTSRIDVSGNGDVEIDTAYSNIEITGHNGNVKIGEVTGSVSLSTNQGDIEIASAYENLSIETQYGNANIQFNAEAPQYSKLDGGRSLVASTKNGHIVAKGVQNANVTIRDKGRVSLDYDRVRGDNSITAATIGSVNVVVPYEEDDIGIAFNLKTESEVLPDIKVGTVSSQEAVLGNGVYLLNVTDIYGNGNQNTLYIKTVLGNIKVRSRELIDF